MKSVTLHSLKYWFFFHRIKRVSLLISSVLFSLENSSKMGELFPTTTSRKSLPSTWSFDWEEECKSSSRPSPEKLLPSRSKPLTLLKMSKRKSRYVLRLDRKTNLIYCQHKIITFQILHNWLSRNFPFPPGYLTHLFEHSHLLEEGKFHSDQ